MRVGVGKTAAQASLGWNVVALDCIKVSVPVGKPYCNLQDVTVGANWLQSTRDLSVCFL